MLTGRDYIMESLRQLAEAADRRGDKELRDKAIKKWRQLATDAEKARAPKLLQHRAR